MIEISSIIAIGINRLGGLLELLWSMLLVALPVESALLVEVACAVLSECCNVVVICVSNCWALEVFIAVTRFFRGGVPVDLSVGLSVSYSSVICAERSVCNVVDVDDCCTVSTSEVATCVLASLLSDTVDSVVVTACSFFLVVHPVLSAISSKSMLIRMMKGFDFIDG